MDKALGQKTGVTAARCYEKREPVEGKFFRFEKGKAWVPDVIDEVKWVTTEDAMRYIGVQRLRHIDWEHKGFVNAEIRPLRGAVCITVEDLLRLKWWKKVCKLTHHKFGLDMADALLELPIDLAIDFIRLYRAQGWGMEKRRRDKEM